VHIKKHLSFAALRAALSELFEQIQCPGCLTHQGAKGPLRYSHQILQAVMLHSHMRQVLPLAPEPVANSDGHRKQDCELAAAKRILPKIRTAHPRLPIIISARIAGLSRIPLTPLMASSKHNLFWCLLKTGDP
jgi:hypothetical protein